MNNPMDLMEVARDLIRKDECQSLFELLYAEHKRFDKERLEKLAETGEDDYRYADGLEFAMDILDARIGLLRDRWTDSEVFDSV